MQFELLRYIEQLMQVSTLFANTTQKSTFIWRIIRRIFVKYFTHVDCLLLKCKQQHTEHFSEKSPNLPFWRLSVKKTDSV